VLSANDSLYEKYSLSYTGFGDYPVLTDLSLFFLIIDSLPLQTNGTILSIHFSIFNLS
jgi:hypothetical protein